MHGLRQCVVPLHIVHYKIDAHCEKCGLCSIWRYAPVLWPERTVHVYCLVVRATQTYFSPLSFIPPTSWFVLSCAVRPAGLEIDTWAGAIEGFVAAAAAANGNVASDCPGSTVVPGYSVTLCTSLLGPGEQVTLWLSEGRWEDVEHACWCIVVHVGKQDREKGDSGGEWKGEDEM